MTILTAALTHNSCYLKQRSNDNGGGGHDQLVHDTNTQKTRIRQRQHDATLNCRYCRYRITHPDERTEISQRHLHTFVNPHGLTYRIGCFASAPGARAQGEATELWTWFPGYRWQIAICGSCGVHLGWRYGAGEVVFFGLIVDRLVEQPISPPPVH